MQTSNATYELLDFGRGRKLERFDDIILDRPEVLAVGAQNQPRELWNKAVAVYQEKPKDAGVWKKKGAVEETWNCNFALRETAFKLQLSLGKFKHLGVFPEQEKHWDYLFGNLSKGKKLLNLFGYTGASSIVGAMAGAEVFHVDSSRSILKVARENAALNDITNIHWVQEDALKFALREVRRQNQYDLIVMDPPVFGRGRKGEIWKLEEGLEPLLKAASDLLVKNGTLILNTYSPKLGLNEMIQVCEKYELHCIDSGWLSVSTNRNDALKLSKYVLASSST